MGYLMTYAFMFFIAFGCVGGYSFIKFLNDYYKEDLGE